MTTFNKFFTVLNYTLSEEVILNVKNIINKKTEFTGPYENLTKLESLLLDKNSKWVLSDPFLNLLLKNYASPILIANKPRHCVFWHHDVEARCSINIPIENYEKRMTFFGEKVESNSEYTNLQRVPYKKGNPVLLNAQEYHTSFSYDEKFITILKFEFFGKYTYEKVYQILKDNNYIN